jgi:hypothetical protein
MKYKFQKLPILVFTVSLVFSHGFLYCQTYKIEGKVKNTNSEPLPNVIITLNNLQSLIITSTLTNETGYFNLVLKDSLIYKSINTISANLLGYKARNFPFNNKTNNYNIILLIDTIPLKEVKVVNRPIISKNNDTLSYDVKSFAQINDRTIGDVLSRMPGITVASDGTISFNGKVISNLFIDGDDLMDGRYGVATKSISLDLIRSVDILKNHQPIKVLKNKVLTDNIAVNLVLKDENSLKLSGNWMLGAGLPSQFDTSINLIALSKKFKMLNNLKSNNSGVDYSINFKKIGSTNPLMSFNNFYKPNYLVAGGTASKPDLPYSDYYINKSAVLNLNNLYNFKKDLQVKANFQGFLDQNSLNFDSRTISFLSNDTITYQENQSLKQHVKLANSSITVSKNSEQSFFENNTNFNIYNGNNNSFLNFNTFSFNQNLINKEYDFSNYLSLIPKIKGLHIIGFKYRLNYYANPQNLALDVGLNQNIFNNNLNYAGLSQLSNLPTWSSEISTFYAIPNTKIKQNYQIGLINESQELNSQIRINNLNGTTKDFENDFGNNLKWRNNRIYFRPDYKYQTEKLNVNLTIPVQLQLTNYEELNYQLNENFKKLNVNPIFSIKYNLADEKILSSKIEQNTLIGNINNIYPGAVLLNYQFLNSNASSLQLKKITSLDLAYHFEKSIRLFIGNIRASYYTINSNTIANTFFSNNLQQTELINLNNNTNVFSISSDLSKYSFYLKSKFQIATLLSSLKTNLFLNNTLKPFVNNTYRVNFNYDTKIVKTLNLVFNNQFTYSIGKNNIDNGFKYNVKRIDNFINLNYNISKSLLLTTNLHRINNYQQNNLETNFLLLNSQLKYSLINKKIDFDLRLSNLLNKKEYGLSAITDNLINISTYDLRNRMMILRISSIL